MWNFFFLGTNGLMLLKFLAFIQLNFSMVKKKKHNIRSSTVFFIISTNCNIVSVSSKTIKAQKTFGCKKKGALKVMRKKKEVKRERRNNQ